MGLRIVDLEQGSPEWHIWRNGIIGASDAAAVLGKSKFMTPVQLFYLKTGRLQPFEGNAATKYGKDTEDAARAAYEIDQGFVEAPPVCILHPDVDCIGASLDGWRADEKIIVEIKCPSEHTHKMALNGEVPEHYWIQMQHQLMCVPEAKVGHFWSYWNKQGALVEVEPDLEFQRDLLKALIEFWALVQSDTCPPLTEKDDKIVDDSAVQTICDHLVKAKDSDDKKLMDQLKPKVIEFGGHNRIRCGNVLVTKSITKTGKDSYRLTISKGGPNATSVGTIESIR